MRSFVLSLATMLLACGEAEPAAQIALAEAAEQKEPQPHFDRRAFGQVLEILISSTLQGEHEAGQKRLVAAGESTDDAWTYESHYREIRETDLDNDGDLDAIVLVDACEATSCHVSTR